MKQHEEKENRKQTEKLVIHHEDLALKTAAQFFGEELLPLLGVSEKLKYIAPTENVKLEARNMYQDFNYILKHGIWMHLEFESDSITRADMRRFREYEASTSRSFKVAVITYVICSSGVKRLMTALTEGINTYRVKVIRLKNEDADRLIADLEAKRKHGKAVKKGDLVPLLLTPLMSGKMGIADRILKSLHILQEESGSVTETELEKMQAVLYVLADKFLNEKELGRVKEVVAMTKLGKMLFKDGMEQGLERGMEQGLSKIVAIIRKKTKKNMDVSTIAEDLELEEEYVKRVVDLLSEDGERSDVQVAEILIRQE